MESVRFRPRNYGGYHASNLRKQLLHAHQKLQRSKFVAIQHSNLTLILALEC